MAGSEVIIPANTGYLPRITLDTVTIRKHTYDCTAMIPTFVADAPRETAVIVAIFDTHSSTYCPELRAGHH